MTELIKQHRNEGVLTLTLDRPDKLNALNNSLYTQLADQLLAADEDADVGVIVITGGTTCFTSGNDLADFLEHPPTHLDSPAFRLMNVVIHLQTPLIAAVSGAAIGIGTTLLLHCDQVLVTRACCCRACSVTPAPPACCCGATASTALRRSPAAWPTSCSTTANNASTPLKTWPGACSPCHRIHCARPGNCSNRRR